MTQIILNQPHTHAGIAHEIGDELDVLLHDAEYLVQRGIANFKRGVQKRSPRDNQAVVNEAPAVETNPEPATTEPRHTGDTA
ncbi:MAG: hypothetical protein ABI114_11035 [Rhodanobacter sp.]